MGTATGIILAFLLVFFVVIIWGIAIYNQLVRARNFQQEAWSGVGVFLKKRYDLVPNLLQTVKGYAAHEKNIIDQVSLNRSRAIEAAGLQDKLQAEQQFNQALGKLFAIAESYPDLKASENFRQLQSELSVLETEIEAARRYYNATVRDNNVLIESFPSSIVAGFGKFQKGTFFEMASGQRDYNKTPEVSF